MLLTSKWFVTHQSKSQYAVFVELGWPPNAAQFSAVAIIAPQNMYVAPTEGHPPIAVAT